MRFALGLWLCLFMCACGEEKVNDPEPAGVVDRNIKLEKHTDSVSMAVETIPQEQDSASGPYSVRITKQDGGFGYEILAEGAVIIKQPFIPAVQGNHPFLRLEDAKKTADRLVYKLNNGISPPSFTVEELRGMGVIK